MADSLPSEFTVAASRGHYTVRFTRDINRELLQLAATDNVILIDSRVHELHSARLGTAVDPSRVIVLEATEQQKSYESLTPVIERLLEFGVSRRATLVAIGGGIIQDVTSFIASILFRGVDWAFVPTTLLAQGDSCIGSKSSINVGRYKNQLGGFYPPVSIVIDPGFLDTLPRSEIRSGLGEMCHYFLVDGSGALDYFAAQHVRARSDRSAMLDLIDRSLSIKHRYVEIDEFDRNQRQVFNYGHSFGHAIESVTQYRVPHGIAVTYGMEMSNDLSQRLGFLSLDERDRMKRLLREVRDGMALGEISRHALSAALMRDKKNEGGRLGLILTSGAGKMFKHFVPPDAAFTAWLDQYLGDLAKEGACTTA